MFPCRFPRHGSLNVCPQLLPEGVELVPVPGPGLAGPVLLADGGRAAQQPLPEGGTRPPAM